MAKRPRGPASYFSIGRIAFTPIAGSGALASKAAAHSVARRPPGPPAAAAKVE